MALDAWSHLVKTGRLPEGTRHYLVGRIAQSFRTDGFFFLSMEKLRLSLQSGSAISSNYGNGTTASENKSIGTDDATYMPNHFWVIWGGMDSAWKMALIQGPMWILAIVMVLFCNYWQFKQEKPYICRPSIDAETGQCGCEYHCGWLCLTRLMAGGFGRKVAAWP